MPISIATARTAKRRGVAAMLGILAVLVLIPFGVRAQSGALTLWYDAPAVDWERNGLPIGNGAMGAMLMGGADRPAIEPVRVQGPRPVSGIISPHQTASQAADDATKREGMK
jgi:hypothetical protein